MSSVRKNPSTAVILSFFGLGRFYLDQANLGVLQWLLALVVVGFIWMFIDIFTASSRTEEYNRRKALVVAQEICAQYPTQAPAPAGAVYCSSCGAKIGADTEFCVKCGAAQGSGAPSKKKCPSCAELIQAEAKKCRFCGEMLPVEAGTQA